MLNLTNIAFIQISAYRFDTIFLLVKMLIIYLYCRLPEINVGFQVPNITFPDYYCTCCHVSYTSYISFVTATSTIIVGKSYIWNLYTNIYFWGTTIEKNLLIL